MKHRVVSGGKGVARALVALTATLSCLTTAHAQFVLGGSAGNIDFSLNNLAPGGGGTVFNGFPGFGSGQMLQSGGFYPALNGNINFFGVNGPLNNGIFGFRNPDLGAVGPLTNFGGGSANLAAVRNGGAGIFSNRFSVRDRGFAGVPGVNATAATLTMTGTANYLYTGAARNFTTGMYLGMAASRLANVNSFVEAGLTGSIVVNGATFIMPSIVFGWDGVEGIDPLAGGRGDFIASSTSLVGVDAFGANTVAFRAISRGGNVFIPQNANVQVNLSFTLFGDPASIDFIDIPTHDPTLGPLPELSPGGFAANANAPEPGSIALFCTVGVAVIARWWSKERRKTTVSLPCIAA